MALGYLVEDGGGGGTPSVTQGVEFATQTFTSTNPWTFTFSKPPKKIWYTFKFSISPFYQFYCYWEESFGNSYAYQDGNITNTIHISVNGNTVSIDNGQVAGQTWTVWIYAIE